MKVEVKFIVIWLIFGLIQPILGYFFLRFLQAYIY